VEKPNPPARLELGLGWACNLRKLKAVMDIGYWIFLIIFSSFPFSHYLQLGTLSNIPI